MDEHGADIPEDNGGRQGHGIVVGTDAEYAIITIRVSRQYADALRDGRAGPESLALNVGAPEDFKLLDMAPRKYLPTFADLVDRLSIVQLKEIFIPDHAAEYRAERELIQHDLDLMMDPVLGGVRLDASAVRCVALLMLTNRYIWENETKARAGGPGQDRLLKLTHSINGVRNAAKNELARAVGDTRLDYKVDCFAADLVAEFGNWNVLDGQQ